MARSLQWMNWQERRDLETSRIRACVHSCHPICWARRRLSWDMRKVMLVSNPLSRPFTSMVDAQAAAREASSLFRSRISAHVLFLEFGVCFFKSTTSPYVGLLCRNLEVSALLFCVRGAWQLSKFKLHIISMPAQNWVVRVTAHPMLDWWYRLMGVYR